MRAALAASLVLAIGVAPRAARALEGFVGTRPLAMANSGRAWAVGDSGLLLNPAGMSLLKAYTVEGSYVFNSAAGGANFFHASVVDSTSDTTLAGGLSYTYLSDAPGGIGGTAHEGIGALSLPFGEMVALGASFRYVYTTGSERMGGSSSGFTLDVGGVVRPNPKLSFAVVGTDLTNLAQEGGRAIGYAAAYFPIPDLALVLDGLSHIGSDFSGHGRTSVLGGGELALAGRVVLRAGLGYDGTLGTLRGSAGAALLSEIGAVDVGAQGDFTTSSTQPTRAYVLGVSLRLFIPAVTPESSSAAQ
jgi:hypothetical protein